MEGIGWSIIALITILFGGLVWLLVAEANQWSEFKVAHNCKVIGHMTGDIFNTVGVGANGQVVVGVGSTPSKVGYLCDDGVTYWR